MNLIEKLKPYNIFILRLGLSGVLFWFGTNQIFNPENWVGWIPDWVSTLHPFSDKTFVLINGITEIIIGLGVLIGLFLRFFSALLVLHMLGIVISVGFNEIGVRDFGLLMSSITLYLSNDFLLTIDSLRKKK